jgi:hypothetical protein
MPVGGEHSLTGRRAVFENRFLMCLEDSGNPVGNDCSKTHWHTEQSLGLRLVKKTKQNKSRSWVAQPRLVFEFLE